MSLLNFINNRITISQREKIHTLMEQVAKKCYNEHISKSKTRATIVLKRPEIADHVETTAILVLFHQIGVKDVCVGDLIGTYNLGKSGTQMGYLYDGLIDTKAQEFLTAIASGEVAA